MDDDKQTQDETGQASRERGAKGCGCQTYEETVFPKVTFSTFILSLASSALVHLGEVPEPTTGQIAVNLPAAKQTVDILAMLKDKTTACLDGDECRLLDGLLYELRLKYVQAK